MRSTSLSTKGANTAALFTAENIKKVNVNWDRGKMFENLREDAVFNLVPSRKIRTPLRVVVDDDVDRVQV